MTDEPRDRSFGPAVQAAVERAAQARIVPTGSLMCGVCGGVGFCRCRAGHTVVSRGLRSDTCAAGALGIAGTDNVVTWKGGTYAASNFGPYKSTITPPRDEPLSPYLRAELERIGRDVDAAREALRRILERS